MPRIILTTLALLISRVVFDKLEDELYKASLLYDKVNTLSRHRFMKT